MLLPVPLDRLAEDGRGQPEPGVPLDVDGQPGHPLLDRLPGVGGGRAPVHRVELLAAPADLLAQAVAPPPPAGRAGRPARAIRASSVSGSTPRPRRGAGRPGSARPGSASCSSSARTGLPERLDLVGGPLGLDQALGRLATAPRGPGPRARPRPGRRPPSASASLARSSARRFERPLAPGLVHLGPVEPGGRARGRRPRPAGPARLGREPVGQGPDVGLEPGLDPAVLGDPGRGRRGPRGAAPPARRAGRGPRGPATARRRRPARAARPPRPIAPRQASRAASALARSPRGPRPAGPRVHPVDRRPGPAQQRGQRLARVGRGLAQRGQVPGQLGLDLGDPRPPAARRRPRGRGGPAACRTRSARRIATQSFISPGGSGSSAGRSPEVEPVAARSPRGPASARSRASASAAIRSSELAPPEPAAGPARRRGRPRGGGGRPGRRRPGRRPRSRRRAPRGRRPARRRARPGGRPPAVVAAEPAGGQVLLGRDRPGRAWRARSRGRAPARSASAWARSASARRERLVGAAEVGLEAVEGRGRGDRQGLQVVERARPEREGPEVDRRLPLGLGQLGPARGELAFQVAHRPGPVDGLGQGLGEPGGVGAGEPAGDARAGREPAWRPPPRPRSQAVVEPGQLLGQGLDPLLRRRGRDAERASASSSEAPGRSSASRARASASTRASRAASAGRPSRALR